jgi:hypothetical protein
MRIGITLTSALSVGQEYIDLTRTVVTEIAKRNHSIVYGGTEYGMMKELAEGYKQANGKELIGVMSHELAAVTVGYKAYPKLDTELWVEKMGERTRHIFDLADGILILPGGYGTIEELATYVGTKANKIADKPIVLFNKNDFYTDFIKMMTIIFDKGFSKIKIEDLVMVTTDLTAALDYLESYTTTSLPDKFV